MATRRQLEATVSTFLAETVAATDITSVNIAAGEAHQTLALARRSFKYTLWIALAAILLSDLLMIGPVDFGLLPDLHLALWVSGHPYGRQAGEALYHIDPETPHVLGVGLPWGSFFR